MMFVVLILAFQVGQDQDVQQEIHPRARVKLWHDFSNNEVLDRDEIAGWTLAAAKVMHLIAKHAIGKPAEQGWCERLLRGVGTTSLLFVFNSTLSTTSHEYGHFRSFSLAGMTHYKFVPMDDETIYWDDAVNATPFGAFSLMFANQWLGRQDYGATVSLEDWQEYFANPKFIDFHSEFALLSEAGGVNQEQYNAEIIAGEVKDGVAHPLDALAYFPAAIGTATYQLGWESDLSDAIALLAELGIETDAREIRRTSQWPKLFSGSAIALAASMVDYFLTGDEVVKPLRVELRDFSFYWPEFASYLTLFGPTIKASASIGYEKHDVTFSYEWSLPVEEVADVGIGWRGPVLGPLSGEMLFVRNVEEGWWFEATAILRLSSWLGIGVKHYQGRGYTFRREIIGQEPHFLEERERGVKGFLEVSITY